MPRTLPMFLVMGMIFYFSHQPGDALNLPGIFGIDKVLHAFVFGLLAVTVIFAVKPYIKKRSQINFGIGIVIFCFVYGLSDEVHQSFIPGRYASGWDLLADVSGALLIVANWLNKIKVDRGDGAS